MPHERLDKKWLQHTLKVINGHNLAGIHNEVKSQ